MFSLKRMMAATAATAMLGWQSLGMAQGLPDFTELVEEVSLAVVNISTSRAAAGSPVAGGPGMPDLEGLPPIFREFFEHSFPQGPRSNRADSSKRRSRLVRDLSCPRMVIF